MSKNTSENNVHGDVTGDTANGEEIERNSDGSVRLRNPNIARTKKDVLYHLALDSHAHDLVEMFGDVKFVCMGGTAERMEQFAYYVMEEIGYKLPAGTTLHNISRYGHRYSMYKVGPVLSISHGMGVASIGILLHEMIKLMFHAEVKDPVFFRIGTSGGIGVEPGTVIVSNGALDSQLRPLHEIPVLGKLVQRPANLDQNLARELHSLAHPEDPFTTVTGKTMCGDDFYESQGRLDGAICEYTENEKMEFLQKVYDSGVRNIEMECTAIAALTHVSGIRSAIVCVTLLDRLKGDQLLTPKEILNQWQLRPQQLVSRYIKKQLQR